MSGFEDPLCLVPQAAVSSFSEFHVFSADCSSAAHGVAIMRGEELQFHE